MPVICMPSESGPKAARRMITGRHNTKTHRHADMGTNDGIKLSGFVRAEITTNYCTDLCAH